MHDTLASVTPTRDPRTGERIPTRVRYALHVPALDNAGASLHALHVHVQHVLARDFGGFTTLEGSGYWGGTHAGHEQIAVYVVDVIDTSHAFATLHALGGYVKRTAAQDAVYLTRSPIEVFLV